MMSREKWNSCEKSRIYTGFDVHTVHVCTGQNAQILKFFVLRPFNDDSKHINAPKYAQQHAMWFLGTNDP